MIGIGLIFGLGCFILKRHSMWALSGLTGFAISLYILPWRDQGLIHKKGGHIALLVGSTALGMLVGAYVTILGGFLCSYRTFLSPSPRFLKTDLTTDYLVTTNTYVMLRVLDGFALLTIVVRVFCWKKHRHSLVTKGRTIHEFDHGWTVFGVKHQAATSDPTCPGGDYGATSTSRNNATVYNEKSWNPF